MRARSLASVFAAALLLAGCGAEFKLPTEIKVNRGFPSDGSYQRVDTWNNMNGITDIVLTQGGGSQLFLVFKSSAAGPARVVEYALTNDQALPYQITDLINPVAAAWQAPNRLFVLDQGDTATARVTADTTVIYDADCGPLAGFRRPIADLSRYWRVREYDLDGDTVSTFTDTTFASVNGIAVDSQGRVYVSGVIMHCDVDPFDSRIKTLDSEFRVYRYVRGGSDPDMPGASWQRDRSWELAQGTGIGSTIDPRQMYWDGFGGGGLYFADLGNDEVQKFGEAGGSSFKIDEGDSSLLAAPNDVALDRAGYVYLVDAGNQRVLRHDPNGEYVQRVDFDVALPAAPLVAPAAVAADDSLVYVADPGANIVIRYKRRK